ncbi:MAG: hypothetical protein WC744_00215 [Patescibacteria group bacterium]|jgi:hypothetical protein
MPKITHPATGRTIESGSPGVFIPKEIRRKIIVGTALLAFACSACLGLGIFSLLQP